MRVIHKFPFIVNNLFGIDMKIGAQILGVETQFGQPCIWALVDPEAGYETREFRVVSTGFGVPDGTDLGTFVGTFMLHEGRFVGHLFDLGA